MNKKVKLVVERTAENVEVKLIMPFLNESNLIDATYETENGWTSVIDLSDKEVNSILKENAMENLGVCISDALYTINDFKNQSELYKCKDQIIELIDYISGGGYSSDLLDDLQHSHALLGAALNLATHYKNEKDSMNLESIAF